MKFKLTKASDPSIEKEIEIYTIEALWAFVKEHGKIIVGHDYNDKPEITIYDYYME